MTKIKVTKPDNDGNFLELKTNRPIIVCCVLNFCEWKNEISFSDRQIIITNALNNAIEKDGLIVLGYLIAKRRVLLVLESKELEIDMQIKAFENYVRPEVELYINYTNSEFATETNVITLEQDFNQEEDYVIDIFQFVPLYNTDIFHLLTGRAVNRKYYSPALVKLKETLHDYQYSSVKNYYCMTNNDKPLEGEKTTAVKVKLMPKEFWERDLIKLDKWSDKGWIKYIIKN